MVWIELVVAWWLAMLHPLHLTYTQLDLDAKGANVTVKLFADDFGTALSRKAGTQISLADTANVANKKLVMKYIAENLKLADAKGRLASYRWQGWEWNHEAVWVHCRAKWPDGLDKVLVINSLMLDVFRDQKNLLIRSKNGDERPFSFDWDVRQAWVWGD